MKYGLIIGDLTAARVADILDQLEDGDTTVDLQTGAPVTMPTHSSIEPTAPRVAPKIEPGEGLDAEGCPWDERIHASTKRKTAKNVWQRKRGIHDFQYEEIKAELLADTETDEIPAQAPSAPAAALPPMPTPAPASPPAPQPSAPPPARDFRGLMSQLNILFSQQKINPSYPNGIVERIKQGYGEVAAGLMSLNDIAENPGYIEFAWKCLEVDGYR